MSDLWQLTLSDFRARTASSDPTPGGGSVAAVTGALGCSLLQMAAQVTLARKDLTDELRDQLTNTEREISEYADQLAALVAADVAAFESLMQAYRLPRDSEEALAHRRAEIASRSSRAAEVPLRMVEIAGQAAASAGPLEGLVTAHIRSDVLAGADLLRGAMGAARHTVEINLPSLGEAEQELLRHRLRDADALARPHAPTTPEESA